MPLGKIRVVYDKRYDEWIGHTENLPHGEILGDTKKQVVDRSKTLANRYGAKVIVEKKNGTQQYTRTYGDTSSGGNSSQRSGGRGPFGLF